MNAEIQIKVECMKKLFLLTILAVASHRLVADAATPAPADSAMISIPKQVKGVHEINLRIDPLTDEQLKNGLTMEMIKEAVTKRLSDFEIPVSETVAHPILVLRVKSILFGVDIATYFQLSLMEESMLLRSRTIFNAITWSQASLLSCRPEDLKQEVTETVDTMVQAFAKDYKKSVAPVVITN